ncbi:hypothetical protein C8Q73DRAFT_788743 [Cubamyces lactineus]|nr:hypothetical protein C8Q73DRAFT_788743 [Cubamyces lactineus]
MHGDNDPTSQDTSASLPTALHALITFIDQLSQMETNGAIGVSPALLLDISSLVMTFCDLPTMSCLMRTCSTLYEHSSARLLRDEPTLKSQDAVMSFCLFMNAGNGARYPFLRKLWLDLESKLVPKHVGRHLQCLFNQVTALEELTIFGLDELLETYPPLAGAIAALTTLKKIYFYGCRHRAIEDLMPQIRSPLTHISVGFRPEDEPTFLESLSDRELLGYHPVRMLSRFAGTLESVDTDYGASGLTGKIKSRTVYPLVRELWLSDGWPTMRPWIDAFPALRRLSNFTDECNSDILAREPRQKNMDGQLSDGSWAALEECSGSIYGVYVLGLTCPVERMMLSEISADFHVQMLLELLAIARPVHLHLQVNRRLLGGTVEEGIPATFRRHSAQLMLVRKLELQVSVKGEDSVSGPYGVLSEMTHSRTLL